VIRTSATQVAITASRPSNSHAQTPTRSTGTGPARDNDLYPHRGRPWTLKASLRSGLSMSVMYLRPRQVALYNVPATNSAIHAAEKNSRFQIVMERAAGIEPA
jgi:hypothetical protein